MVISRKVWTLTDFPKIEITILLTTSFDCRYLEHKNVARFFGAIKVNVSNKSKDFKFLFVSANYQKNLRNVVCKDKSKVPAKASNSREAIGIFLIWAKEIANALNYIHELGLVHRYLTMDSILVSINCISVSIPCIAAHWVHYQW